MTTGAVGKSQRRPAASNPIGEGIGHGGDNRERETMYQWATNFLMFAYTH